MNDHPENCPRCTQPVPADAPGGICPACAMLVAADLPGAPAPTSTAGAVPTLDEVAAAFPELEVLEMIGRGGMGIVFKALQPRLDRFVALKILSPALAAQPGFPERFTREARVLARLSHPHIVSVFDFGDAAGFCYLLMEYVDGVNLRQAMEAGITPAQSLMLVPQVCEALQFAHDRGVLHRDIKPENILLDRHGRPKLADFGIAKLAEDSGKPHLTQSGVQLGTAAYMAPEQIENPGTVDHRADIYSLGVVLYEMLTGELPLGRFAAPSERSSVGESVDLVVLRALEKERERRQQSAGEMKTQIVGACESRPAPATSVLHVPQESARKDLGFAYLWWFIFGVCGGHRFYLRQYGWGWLYLFTGGLCGIGWLVDLFLLPSEVRRVNQGLPPRRPSPTGTRPWLTPAIVVFGVLLALVLSSVFWPIWSINVNINGDPGKVEVDAGRIKIGTDTEKVEIGWDGIHVSTDDKTVKIGPTGIRVEQRKETPQQEAPAQKP